MEVSLYYPKSRALISCFNFPSSSSAISLSPVFKCRPPGLRWYNNSRKSRYKAQIPRCSLQDSIIERYLVAFAATAAAFAAIRVVFAYFAERRRGHVSSLEVLDRKLEKDTKITEEIKHDAQNATNEVSHHITKPLEAESVETQVAIFEEEDNHNTSEVLVSNLKEENHNTSEILVSNLKEELEMNSISKAFAPVNALEFAVTHSEGSLIKPEYKEGRNTVAFIKEGPASKIKKLEKKYESKKTGGKNDKLSHNITNGKSNQFPLVNGFKKGSNDPKENLLIYNSLLKDGRLRDCVDLLENMENEGILNMEKIHHSSFLNACKNRKAIKEAIRFVKLIKKPKMSTFNMLLSVCASSQDSDGAYQVMALLKEAGLRPDCKLYTTLISAFGKSGKVDTMFEVFHEMVNGGIEANVNTYGALIDGCARAGQVAKAFGAYGIMRSKNVVPDRVIFNALITTCGESGAVDRAFDVLSEMLAENIPVLPDHVTVGALIKTCINARMVDRAREVYKMLEEYEIIGTVEVYTIAIRSCSLNGDLQFALQVYEDMKRKKIKPDEMFLSTLINVAGNAGDLEVAFKILNEARNKGTKVANISYSSLMGACCNAKDWEKALELYEEIKSKKITPAVSMMNALITALCENGQIVKSLEILEEMKKLGVQPNNITYTVLIIACEKNDEAELAFQIFEQAKIAEITITPTICGCLTGLCLQRYEKDSSLGNVSITFNLGKPQISNKWTSLAIDIYSEIISAGLEPKMDALSQVMGCMKFPNDSLSRNKIIENNLGFGFDVLNGPNISSLLDGFGEYDPRSFHILEEAAAKGMVNRLILEEPKSKGMGKKSSFKAKPLIVDVRKLQLHIAEVYVIATLKTLKHHLAAGAILPTVSILLPTEKTQVELSKGKTLNLAGRIGQAVGSLLRRLGVKYKGGESHGKIIITGLTLKRWFEPKLDENTIPRNTFLGNGNTFLGNGNSFPGNGNTYLGNESTFLGMIPNPMRLRKGIADQQRNIRSGTNLSFED